MILITGGAGYVGRHVARALSGPVGVIDDLRSGAPASRGVALFLREDLAVCRPDWSKVRAVIHCAGSIEVRESVEKPAEYWWNNVGAAAAFFRTAPKGLPVVLSSSAAVYGDAAGRPLREDDSTIPTNPYGQTKLALERMLADLGFRLTVLRYFNAAGGDEDHRPETHLIPRVLRAAKSGEPIEVYGDGRQVRDFVHVDDLAEAHVRALDRPGIYNLGSGRGFTVLEVIEEARKVTGREIRAAFGPPRPGEPRCLIADISRAERELGWSPKLALTDILASQWEATIRR